MIELGMAKYRDLSVSRRSIICRKLRLATDNHDILLNLVQ